MGVLVKPRLSQVRPEGTAGQYPKVNATEDGWDYDTPSSGGGGGAPLAVVVYNPGSQTVLSTTSTSYVDASAANLVITFTAPASGTVFVVLEAVADVAADGERVSFILRDASGNVSGTGRVAGRTANGQRIRTAIRITGLTSGTSYTYKWGIATSNAAFAARLLTGGGDSLWGPAQMEVYEA